MALAGLSRQRPWPYDLYVGETKCLLLADDNGNLMGRKTRTLDQSAPTTFEYGSANPMKERTFLWSKLYSGLGQSTAPTPPEVPARYSYGVNADSSIDGKTIKGPMFSDHDHTVHASAGEVRQFITALHGGVETLFAICENGVYRRTGDNTWVASLTTGTAPALGVGQFPQQAVRFKSRGASPIDALYVASSTGNLWQYSGSAWALAGALAGPGTGGGNGEARFIEKVGDELWVAGNYWIMKAENDPMDRAQWSGAIYIGDQTCKITWLKQVNNTLFIFKSDGIYTVSADGVDQELFPTLRGNYSTDNGKNAAVWINQLWIPFGGKTYRLGSDGQLVPDGLEQLLDNSSPIKGHFVAGAGHNTWFFYEVYYNPQTGDSYLIKHGTWVDDGTGKNVQFLSTAHHGALAEWDKEVTSCQVVSGIHASGNDRLYIGFADGTATWCVLPQAGPNPYTDPNCEFTQDDSYLYLPTHHSGFQADNKLYRGISVFGPNLTNSEWVEIEYRLDITNPSASWSTLSVDGDAEFTVPGQRKDFSTTDPVWGRAIQFRIKLLKDPDEGVSPLNQTPAIEGIAVHEQIRPAISIEYTFTIDASTHAVRRDGTIDRRRGARIKEELLSQTANAGPTLFLLPDGTEEQMTITDYQQILPIHSKRRDLEWVVQITAIQLAALTQTAISSGITYATLEQYTYGELETIL